MNSEWRAIVMKLRKVTSVGLIAGLCFSAVTGLAAGTQFADPNAVISIGGATGTEAAGRVRVDATAGASIMITPDQNYGPLSYPERDGRRVPDNLKPDSPATARVVIRGERTDFGLNTNTSKNGTAMQRHSAIKRLLRRKTDYPWVMEPPLRRITVWHSGQVVLPIRLIPYPSAVTRGFVR